MDKNLNMIDWILRFIKGMFIGSGAILPGVSGGALAAVFGIYEQIITFLSNIKKNFYTNVLFFLPVGLGGLFGVFILAYPIDYFLDRSPAHILWFFIGCILGTLPTLYREAGKKGRERKHIILAVATAIISFVILLLAEQHMHVEVEQNTVTWLMSGAIFASGFIIPGLSPSNFLIYMNLYEPLTEGIRDLDFSILIPVAIGAVLCILLLSRVVRYLMEIAYASIFHFVLGIVFASTVIIAPSPQQYAGFSFFTYLFLLLLFIVGVLIGLWMGRLEKEYKPELN